MLFRIMVTLSETEAAGLARLSTREVRSPREQLRFLLRRELVQSGLLPPELGTGVVTDPIHINQE
jgi:hypothetical protein